MGRSQARSPYLQHVPSACWGRCPQTPIFILAFKLAIQFFMICINDMYSHLINNSTLSEQHIQSNK